MRNEFTAAESLKFAIFDLGITLDAAALTYVTEHLVSEEMTPADYASTSGVILCLDGDVWVNAPIAANNPNFVDHSPITLFVEDGSLAVRYGNVNVAASFWVPPAFHGTNNDAGESLNSYVFTHTDRARVSPIEGCAMTCRFCDLPYEYRYRTKNIERMVAATAAALEDPVQPAAHVLVSGGTPREADFGYVTDSYMAILGAFPEHEIDIMMVPYEQVFDFPALDAAGLAEVSINLELFNRDLARHLMRRKHDQGRDNYLGFLETAADALGGDRVRSMLLVGLESMEDTLEGVQAITDRGCVPVLSPFRPDRATPLREKRPPTAEFLAETYLRSLEITRRAGVRLGPRCIPCSHNTLTLSVAGCGDANMSFGSPKLV